MLMDFIANLESRAVMEDRLWRFHFGQAVEHRERSVINHVAMCNYCSFGASKMHVIAAIMLSQDCSEPTARKILDRCCDKNLVECVRDQSNGTRRLYRITSDVANKISNISAMLPIIAIITIKQSKNPNDADAGKSDLPDEIKSIYFNARDDENINDFCYVIGEKVKSVKGAKK